MTSILITAFEPYGSWPTNASWLCLMEFARDLPRGPTIVTRRYPVDFAAARQRLEADLEANFDYAIHLGQAPGSSVIRLEALAVNAGGVPDVPPERHARLCADGPEAYRCQFPLADWAALLRSAGIPAAVSFHAGTYLCNAMLYWSCYLAERRALRTKAAFLHLPLELSQVSHEAVDRPSMPAEVTARALHTLIEGLDRQELAA